MHLSTQVDFSRRFGKSIGSSISGLKYQIKKEIEQLEETDKRQLYCASLDNLIKEDLLLCDWLYYNDYEQFLEEFKKYISSSLSDEEFKLITDSSIHLGQIMDNFWLESNDPELKSEYTHEKALEEYITRVEKNGYTYKKEDDDNEHYKLILKNIYYRHKNEDLVNTHFNMKQQLKYARLDDILQSRTQDQWAILYSLRYLYKNVVNILINKNISGDNIFQLNLTNNTGIDFDFNNNTNYQINSDTNDSELYKIKKNLEDLLMLYQESSEGLEWHNPYSDKRIDSIEYFPRATSKPSHDWAYSKYYDLENNAHNVVNNMINIRKRKREESSTNLEKRFKNIRDLMEQRSKRIQKIYWYISNGIYYGTRLSVLVAFGAFIYSYYM